MKKYLVLILLFILSNNLFSQYLITVVRNQDYRIRSYHLLLNETLEKGNIKDSIRNFDVFSANLFNYIICREYGTLNFNNIDSLNMIDSVENVEWKVSLALKYSSLHYKIKESIVEKSQNKSFKFQKKGLKISIVRLSKASFCECTDNIGINEESIYSVKEPPSFIKLVKSEKLFFKKQIQYILNNVPKANPILWR